MGPPGVGRRGPLQRAVRIFGGRGWGGAGLLGPGQEVQCRRPEPAPGAVRVRFGGPRDLLVRASGRSARRLGRPRGRGDTVKARGRAAAITAGISVSWSPRGTPLDKNVDYW